LENTKNIFSINLRRIIDDKGLKYAAAAEVLEISVAFLSNLMRGQKTPSLEMIYKIADKLNVKVTQLFEDPDDPRPSKSDLILDIIRMLPSLDEDELCGVLNIIRGQPIDESAPAMIAPK
jgi:transcriptional regulator with XRE-family HTH domain